MNDATPTGNAHNHDATDRTDRTLFVRCLRRLIPVGIKLQRIRIKLQGIGIKLQQMDIA